MQGHDTFWGGMLGSDIDMLETAMLESDRGGDNMLTGREIFW